MSQFDTFDNRMDRKEILILFQRFGEGRIADERRKNFLQSIITYSGNGFAKGDCRVMNTPENPCNALNAYQLFIAITGVLGVKIKEAVALLEGEIIRAGRAPLLRA